MLRLPDNWRRCTGGWVAGDVLRQAEALRKGREALFLIVHACVEILAYGWRVRGRPTKRVEVVGREAVRLERMLVRVLYPLEDEVVMAFAELPQKRGDTTVVAAPGFAETAKHAFNSLGYDRRFDVIGLDAYASFRVTFSSIDAGISRGECMEMLFGWYHCLAEEAGEGSLMLAEFARSSVVNPHGRASA